MKKPVLKSHKLNKNDKEVLRSIILQAKTPDIEIARKLKISQQAVFKIRKKLEQSGIITGYMPIINFKKIGIKILVVLAVKVKPSVWKRMSDEEVSRKILQLPSIVGAYRVPESEISHLLMLGFHDIDEKDSFMMKMETKFCDEIEIKNTYQFSAERIITQSPMGLLSGLLSKKEKNLEELFIRKDEKKQNNN